MSAKTELKVLLGSIVKEIYDADIRALQANGMNLVHIKNPSAEQCLIAVKQNGYALQYVPFKIQTYKICLEAVKKHGLALQYVKKQTPKVCLEAIKQDKASYIHVNDDIKKQIGF